jgi:hypothetical protein
MNCRRVQRLLSDHRDIRPADVEARAMDGHVDRCPACRRRREELAGMGADLRAWGALLSPPEADDPLPMERRVVDRWLREWPGTERRSPLARRSRALAAIAAVASLICFAVVRWPAPRKAARSAARAVASRPDGSLAGRIEPAVAARPRPNAAPDVASGDPFSSRRPPPPSPTPSVRRDDMDYLNAAPKEPLHAPSSTAASSEQRAASKRAAPPGDDFVTIPPPRIAAAGEGADRAAALALAAHQREAAVTDSRLTRRLTLGVKATALDKLCDRMREETGIALRAGRSVADEKVTLFCRAAPLRQIMRVLSRPFGYTWLRSGKEGEYRYELAQDLRSQLLEEELRNRDRNAALIDIDRVMQGYRDHLGLSPGELHARIDKARPGEAKIPAHLAGTGWGPLQLYSQLGPADVAALRAGQTVVFSVDANPGEHPLPPDLARGVLQSVHDRRIKRDGDRFEVGPVSSLPDGLLPASVPEARAVVKLRLDWSELGEVTLQGLAGFRVGDPKDGAYILGDDGPIAVGVSPAVRSPENAVANARLAATKALQARVTVAPAGRVSRAPLPAGERVTVADVLEALHKATGMNLVADHYTRFYDRSAVSVRDKPLFEALNRLADAMRLRWSREGDWLQFRSASWFHDRLKEVPNRLLDRWATSRRKHGVLTLEDLVEIAQLSDAQLDSQVTAEGARALYDLEEWTLARNGWLRPQWRFLAGLTPGQREQAARGEGLLFSQFTLSQQQQFLKLALPSSASGGEPSLTGLEDLGRASLRVEYRTAGKFQWKAPVPPDAPAWRKLLPSPVYERDPERALAAARAIRPETTAAEIAPSEPEVVFIFSLGGPGARFTPLVVRADRHNTLGAPPRPVAR